MEFNEITTGVTSVWFCQTKSERWLPEFTSHWFLIEIIGTSYLLIMKAVLLKDTKQQSHLCDRWSQQTVQRLLFIWDSLFDQVSWLATILPCCFHDNPLLIHLLIIWVFFLLIDCSVVDLTESGVCQNALPS